MPSPLLTRLRQRWLPLLCMAALLVGLPVGCAVLEHKERELLFRIPQLQALGYSVLAIDYSGFGVEPAVAVADPDERRDVPARAPG